MITAMFRIARRSFGFSWAVVIVTVGAWVWTHSAPSWSTMAADSLSRYFGGWTGSGCERNKDVCLTAKLSELDALHTDLARAVNGLADRKGQIARDLSNRDRDFAANAALIEEGRQIYIRSTEFRGTVRFSGREYTPDTLKRRLEVLYQQGPSLQASVKQAKGVDEAVDRKLHDLLVKKANIRATRDLLPSQIELLRANMIIGDIDATLRDVTKLYDDVKRTVSELKDVGGWMARTNELIKRQVDAERRGPPLDFNGWLNGTRDAAGTPVRQEAP
jgi:hypothetical protein